MDKCINLRFFESSENVKYLNASLIIQNALSQK